MGPAHKAGPACAAGEGIHLQHLNALGITLGHLKPASPAATHLEEKCAQVPEPALPPLGARRAICESCSPGPLRDHSCRHLDAEHHNHVLLQNCAVRYADRPAAGRAMRQLCRPGPFQDHYSRPCRLENTTHNHMRLQNVAACHRSCCLGMWQTLLVDTVTCVPQGKIKKLEDIFLFSMPIKEYQIVEFFLGTVLKDEVMKIMPVQKQTRAGQRTRFKVHPCFIWLMS